MVIKHLKHFLSTEISLLEQYRVQNNKKHGIKTFKANGSKNDYI